MKPKVAHGNSQFGGPINAPMNKQQTAGNIKSASAFAKISPSQRRLLAVVLESAMLDAF
jgi:hypothetical protein